MIYMAGQDLSALSYKGRTLPARRVHPGVLFDNLKDLQRIKYLALHMCERGEPCTVKELCEECLAFPITAPELLKLLELPNSPLELRGDLIIVKDRFSECLSLSFCQLLQRQNKILSSKAPPRLVHQDIVSNAPGKTGSAFIGQTSPQVLEVTGSEFNDLFTGKEEALVAYKNAPVSKGGSNDGLLLLPGGAAAIFDNRSGRQQEDVAIPCNGQGAGASSLPVTVVTESPAIQSTAPLLDDSHVQQPKQKSREPRIEPRFQGFCVEGEVGTGGYGTVYKAQRLADGQIFAIKCPLENTNKTECVRNEIKMLQRLRGKNCIINFEGQVIGKVAPKPDAAGGGGKDVEYLSIVLEFIEHDKPEVLKREITIEELRWYSSSLFKALAQLHKERIIHLDVKPGNFLFSRSTRRGCLVDFNLAREQRVFSNVQRESKARTTVISRRLCLRTSWVSQMRTPESKKFCGIKRPRPALGPGPEDIAGTPLKPSKRGRMLLELSNVERQGSGILRGTPPVAKPIPYSLGQFKEIETLAPSNAIASPYFEEGSLKVKQNHPNASVSQAVREPQTQKCGPLPKAGHPLLINEVKRLHVCHESTQGRGVAALKAKGKRVGAEVPSHPHPRSPRRPINATTAKLTSARGKNGLFQYPVKDGPCVGTKGFRAPEVLMRSQKQTTKVDIWSAGVTLLQLVTGRSPFPSANNQSALKDIAKMRGSTKMEGLANSLHQRWSFDKSPPVPVKTWSEKMSRRSDVKGKIPAALYDLIEKCLEVNPEARITAEEALRHPFLSTPDADLAVSPPRVV